MVGTAVITGLLAVVASVDLGIPLRDPDGFLGPSYVRLPALVGLFLLLDVVPRGVLRARAVGRWGEGFAQVVRERWVPARLVAVIVGLGSFYVTYVGYRNLKSYLPILRDDLDDSELVQLDHWLSFGLGPARILHELLGTGVAAYVLSAVYLFFLMLVPLSLAFALVWVHDPRRGYWYVTALCLNWALGTASYYLLPSLGPIYVDPIAYADLPVTGVSDLQESLMRSRIAVLADPTGTDRIHGIAAFASLHVSIVVTMALVAQLMRLWAVLRYLLWGFAVLTATATIYFGWHYLADVVAGLAIAVASVWFAAMGTSAHHRRPMDPVEQESSRDGDAALQDEDHASGWARSH